MPHKALSMDLRNMHIQQMIRCGFTLTNCYH